MSKKNQSDKAAQKPAHEQEIKKSLIDRITNRRTFEPFDKPTVGCRFIRFRQRGQEVAGYLGFPIVNFRHSTSYPIKLDSGEIVEIVGNRLLHKQIRDGELCGQRVKIVYQGRDFTHAGHYRKVFRIFKIGHKAIPSDVWNRIFNEAKGAKKDGKGTKTKAGALSEL